MPITIKWLTEGQVCLITAPHTIDAETLKTYDAEMVHWLDNTSKDVCIIADLQAMQKVTSLTHLIALKHPRHPRFKRAATIGLTLNSVSRFFFPVVAQMIGIQYKDFNTLDEALAYLHEVEGV